MPDRSSAVPVPILLAPRRYLTSFGLILVQSTLKQIQASDYVIHQQPWPPLPCGLQAPVQSVRLPPHPSCLISTQLFCIPKTNARGIEVHEWVFVDVTCRRVILILSKLDVPTSLTSCTESAGARHNISCQLGFHLDDGFDVLPEVSSRIPYVMLLIYNRPGL
ncbi:hypothetical protein B0H19DRAFT_1241917 [Mycena capillaripes]|nr:hypothetical protein B0H19DRAFT_1241917 [Mycena capillaripes]